MHANVQSLLSKKAEIEVRINDTCFDLLFFTEVWLDQSKDNSEFMFKGYQSPVINFCGSSGACVFVKTGLSFIVDEPPYKVEQSVWVSTKTFD